MHAGMEPLEHEINLHLTFSNSDLFSGLPTATVLEPLSVSDLDHEPPAILELNGVPPSDVLNNENPSLGEDVQEDAGAPTQSAHVDSMARSMAGTDDCDRLPAGFGLPSLTVFTAVAQVKPELAEDSFPVKSEPAEDTSDFEDANENDEEDSGSEQPGAPQPVQQRASDPPKPAQIDDEDSDSDNELATARQPFEPGSLKQIAGQPNPCYNTAASSSQAASSSSTAPIEMSVEATWTPSAYVSATIHQTVSLKLKNLIERLLGIERESGYRLEVRVEVYRREGGPDGAGRYQRISLRAMNPENKKKLPTIKPSVVDSNPKRADGFVLKHCATSKRLFHVVDDPNGGKCIQFLVVLNLKPTDIILYKPDDEMMRLAVRLFKGDRLVAQGATPPYRALCKTAVVVRRERGETSKAQERAKRSSQQQSSQQQSLPDGLPPQPLELLDETPGKTRKKARRDSQLQ